MSYGRKLSSISKMIQKETIDILTLIGNQLKNTLSRLVI